MARLELSDDAWAELYASKKIPERARRPIQRAAVALQRAMPEKGSATVSTKPAVTAGAEVEATPEAAAFGAPPVEQIVAQATEDPILLKDLTDEALAGLDAFNDALILGYTKEWSYGAVTEEVLIDLPGDAFDELLAECRILNKGDDKGEGEDPTEPS